jgi:4-amino-4-deoxychorismate lyase
MCRLFETISIANGILRHPEWHEARMEQAVAEVWSRKYTFNLAREVIVPGEYSAGWVRCNVRYGPDIGEITFSRYTERQVRSLKLVTCDTIDYHLKYSDRSLLEQLFSLRGSADEVIIVRKGLITDTSVSNLVFFDGISWFTPAEPLLRGTCRERLLGEGRIREIEIRPGDLGKFSGLKLINALRDMDESEMIPVSEIAPSSGGGRGGVI